MEYGSEFDWDSNAALLRREAGELPVEDAKYYRSGRDALKALARALPTSRVLLPALSCDSMAVPFALNGWEVVYYKLRRDLSADTGDVLSKLSKGAVLIYMRYFGLPSFSDEFLTQLRERRSDVTLVEDRTQDIVVPRENGFVPDAMIASLRKWTALPEGGVLKTTLNVERGEYSPVFGQLRRAVMEEKSLYLKTWDQELKRAFMARLHGADALLDAEREPCAVSPEYSELLRRVDFGKIYSLRLENVRRLKARLTPLKAAGKLDFLTDAPELSTLYFPILLKDRDKIWRRMIDNKIYCAVIWPIPKAAEGVCPVTEYINRHMLGIICDQRCGADDMDYIADTLEGALKG